MGKNFMSKHKKGDEYCLFCDSWEQLHSHTLCDERYAERARKERERPVRELESLLSDYDVSCSGDKT